jgi:hypothetical protein
MFISARKVSLIYVGLTATLTGCNSVAKTPTANIETKNLTPTPIEITLLQDQNHDGVAEVKQTFGDLNYSLQIHRRFIQLTRTLFSLSNADRCFFSS